MNLQPNKRVAPELNLTPLIDVVFLLLIFFMVSTTFERESQITIELPEAGGEELVIDKRVLDITVDREGRFFVNQQEVINTQVATLKIAISKAVGDDRKIPVLINADAQSPYQAVMSVMDAASQLGLVNMTFVAHKPTGK
ncbi:MAG: biopolymer transporter ExbD [Candidatus Polarisedimenticolaceae bacterium]|nr:biopolymer transporter ExbD [Candidatus Polarisedimenticolaceae bacterium]